MTETPQWIDPLTDPRWPRLVERHPRASVFQSRGWLQALRQTYGYEPAALATGANGELTSGIVFCQVDSWLTGKRLVSLPFSDHCDPLVENDAERSRLIEVFNEAARLLKYVELRPRNGSGEPIPGLTPSGNYVLHRLDLKCGLRSVFAGFHKNHIARKIRRSERERVVYKEGSSETELRAFYKLVIRTRRRHELPPQPYAWFRAVLDFLPGQAKLRLAVKDDTAIAGIITLIERDTMSYKYGASDERFHKYGGVQLLLSKAIEEACDRRCATFDFGRSRADNIGEIEFKDHWGAERAPLIYWQFPAAKRAGYLKGLVGARRVFSLLPDRLLVAAGRSLYRHVG